MADQKPTFAFLKMLGCGHCVNFFEKPNKETSPWATLVRDPELQAAVQFSLIEWGAVKDKEGNLVRHELPAVYQFVNYGPFFYLSAPRASADAPLIGKEFKPEDGYQRNPASMKKWILDTLKKNPNLLQVSSAKRAQVANIPAPAPRAAPAAAIVPAVKPATPAFQPYTPKMRAQPPAPQVVSRSPQVIPTSAPPPAQPPKPTQARFIPRNRRR